MNIVNLVGSWINTAFTIAAINGHLKCVKLLLKANVLLNRCKRVPNAAVLDPDHANLINRNLYHRKYAPLVFTTGNVRSVMFMFAAGETYINLKKLSHEDKDSLRIFKLRHEKHRMFDLKHLCRKAIRTHLIRLNPHLHLFNRIPKLGLPHVETQYLLFDMSIDLESDEDFDRLD